MPDADAADKDPVNESGYSEDEESY
jgi:hypothetical protein